MLDLLDWRRRIADLYAGIRCHSDPYSAWLTWKHVRYEMFCEHPQTPLDRAAGSAGRQLSYFAYDPTMRFLVGLRPLGDAPLMEFQAGADGNVGMRPFAVTDGLAARLGGELTLYWITGYGGGAFLPFTDQTSASETYPGGRYLLDTIKGADLGAAASGQTILDFNFSYNPSCAYSSRWVCPLAPEENRLATPVRAGEQWRSNGEPADGRTAGSLGVARRPAG